MPWATAPSSQRILFITFYFCSTLYFHFYSASIVSDHPRMTICSAFHFHHYFQFTDFCSSLYTPLSLSQVMKLKVGQIAISDEQGASYCKWKSPSFPYLIFCVSILIINSASHNISSLAQTKRYTSLISRASNFFTFSSRHFKWYGLHQLYSRRPWHSL